jgi:hypothetical protein
MLNFIKIFMILSVLSLTGCYKTFLYDQRAAAEYKCNIYMANPSSYSKDSAEYGQANCDAVSELTHDIENSWIPI